MVSLNTCMMRAKISPNMISFITVRRGDWILKVSVFKSKQILVIAQNYYDHEDFHIRFFTKQDSAADYIEQLVSEE